MNLQRKIIAPLIVVARLLWLAGSMFGPLEAKSCSFRARGKDPFGNHERE
jgi:hypothetical protein